jgi:hypothetical protein
MEAGWTKTSEARSEKKGRTRNVDLQDLGADEPLAQE